VAGPGTAAGTAGRLLWRGWLKRKLGGMTGDCLGAGIEICEILLLGLLLLPLHQLGSW
jgi:adenosylcobinamide-GDP ribazoletransferase